MARAQLQRVQKRREEPRASLDVELGAGLEARILADLSELKGKVDESLAQGRECNTDLKLLRKELGIDGPHGRLPILEASVGRHADRLEALETEKIEMHARHRLAHSILAFCGGGVGGTLIAAIGRIFGAR